MSDQRLTTGDHAEDLAWGLTTRTEHRWPATLAVFATLLLYVSLPEQLTVGPTWLMPLLVAMLVIPLSIAAPHRRHDEPQWQGMACGVRK